MEKAETKAVKSRVGITVISSPEEHRDGDAYFSSECPHVNAS